MDYQSWLSVLLFVSAFLVLFVAVPLALSTVIVGWRAPERIRRAGSFD